MNRYRTRKRTVTKNAPVWKWQHVTPRRKTRRKHTTFDSSRSILFRSRSVLLDSNQAHRCRYARAPQTIAFDEINPRGEINNAMITKRKIRIYEVGTTRNKGGITLVLVSLPDQSRNWWSISRVYTFTSRCTLRISNPLFRMQITRGDCSFFETTVTVPFL